MPGTQITQNQFFLTRVRVCPGPRTRVYLGPGYTHESDGEIANRYGLELKTHPNNLKTHATSMLTTVLGINNVAAGAGYRAS